VGRWGTGRATVRREVGNDGIEIISHCVVFLRLTVALVCAAVAFLYGSPVPSLFVSSVAAVGP
jgi:hypothetical protein